MELHMVWYTRTTLCGRNPMGHPALSLTGHPIHGWFATYMGYAVGCAVRHPRILHGTHAPPVECPMGLHETFTIVHPVTCPLDIRISIL